MLRNRRSNSRTFLRIPISTPARQAPRLHACKHHHPILTGRIASRFYETEATREKNIKETQRSSWEGNKPQLHMNAHVLRQPPVAQSAIQERPENRSRSDKVIKTPADSDSCGSSWQSPNEDTTQRTWRERIHKEQRIWREKFKPHIVAEGYCDTYMRIFQECYEKVSNESQDGDASASSHQRLPDPSSSTLHEAGAPTGTAEEIEDDVSEDGWNWIRPVRGYRLKPSVALDILESEERKTRGR